jgi:hypothetical protein
MATLLSQDEIDSMIGFKQLGTVSPQVSQAAPTVVQNSDNLQTRRLQYQWPILYHGEKTPSCYVVRIVSEIYNPRTNQWEYHHHTEKLYKSNGMPYA